MAVTRSAISLEEIFALPEAKSPLKYADGRVTQKASPQGTHAALQSALVERLNRNLRSNTIVVALTHLRATFQGSSRVLDTSVHRSQGTPRDAARAIADPFLTHPSIAIEIRSPDQTVHAQTRQCREHVRDGVTLAVLVDPECLGIWAFRPAEAEQEPRNPWSSGLAPIIQ